MALDEFARIERYFAPLATAAGAFGLRDDAAALSPRAGYDLVLTQDAMIEGVHFLPDDPAADVARKLLRCNLSDLAAKGAVPLGYLLTCAWTRQTSEGWIADFAEGLRQDQSEFGLTLLGGDTVATPGPLSYSLTAIGEVPEGTMVSRGGAKAGDWLFVTGDIGAAHLGLKTLSGELSPEKPEDRVEFAQRYRLPQPRLGFGQGIRSLATSALDVSDGLVGDAGHLAAVSGLGVRILAGDVPLSEAARRVLARGNCRLEDLLTGGDDYEILFTAPGQTVAAIMEIGQSTGVSVTRIGEMIQGSGVEVITEDGQKLSLNSKSYNHF